MQFDFNISVNIQLDLSFFFTTCVHVGLILFTDGVAGFSSPQSQYSCVNQLRTANISCWVVLCGGGTAHSHAPGMIPDTETLGFMTHACNGCLIDPEKVSATVG